jgi:hypothetical protein
MATTKTHQEIIDEIFKLSAEGGTLPELMKKLIRFLGAIDKENLKYYLAISGIIPEKIKHDSSEEKLYSKYIEYLGYLFFKISGFKAEVIDTRSEKADVMAEKDGYKIVTDTKAVRLSRTALNVKDYKIDSLGSTWRIKENADYATLFNPYGFFLKSNSQLYAKAIEYNVTMISYTHLIFILSIPDIEKKDLKPLWEVGKSLQHLSPSDRKSAKTYWEKLDSEVLSLGLNKEKWKECRKKAADQMTAIIEEEVANIERQEQEIINMDVEVLRKKLIKSKKYDKIKASIENKKSIVKSLDS